MSRGSGRSPHAAALFAVILVALPALSQESARCAGDCNNDGAVSPSELLAVVNVALGRASRFGCQPGEASADNQAALSRILNSVADAQNGCQPPLQNQEALTTSARVGVSTMESLSIMDFGFIGLGGAAGAAAAACASVSCRADAESTTFTTVFASCSEPGSTPGSTIWCTSSRASKG